MAASERRCFVHIGLPKSGTSYLQSVFWQSQEALGARGFAMLPTRRADHFTVALQLRGLLQDFDNERAYGSLDRLRADAVRSTAPTTLLSQEALAPSTPSQVAELLDSLAGHEVHVVVTARDLARQVPSAWQQRIQARHTYTYPEFLDAVVNRAPLAQDFWVNQDLVDVLTRWHSHVPVERIHVVVTPPAHAHPDVLLERFCSVVGVDASLLDTNLPSSNVSLGHVQAELQRRVNVALGDRFPHPRAGYGRLGKGYLAGRVLRPQGGARPMMPERLRAWCEETTQQWIEHIGSSGYAVVGDLDELRPSASSFADREEPTEAELLESAVNALATVLEIRDVDQQETAELRQELRRLRRQVRAGGAEVPVTRSLVQRAVGRARRGAAALRRRGRS